MSEPSYSGDRPSRPYNAAPLAPGQSADADLSTEDLSQRILMGMQRDIEAQIDWRLRQNAPSKPRTIEPNEIGVILGTIGIGVPLTAIAAASAGIAGIVVIWLALVLINIAWSLRR
jgi:hypothetical protein